MNRPFGLAGVVMSILVLAGCTGTPPPPPAVGQEVPVPDVLATHEPLHPSDNIPVTFKATAIARKITLRYERRALTLNPDGTIGQSVAEALADRKVCQQSATSPLTCEHRPGTGFPASSLIRFEAIAEGESGATGSESYYFAAGSYPDPDAAVPVRLKTTHTGGLDLIFIGTADLPTEDLRGALKDVVYSLYFKYPELQQGRGVYNYYYSRHRGNYTESCRFSNPSNMATLEATGDAVVFLHRETMRDCKVGKRISSEVSNDKSLIHETGHILFDLQDEYCCDSSYEAQMCTPNLWATLKACQTAAAGLGYEQSACKQLTEQQESLSFWRIDPDGDTGCIMGPGQHSAGSGFRNACRGRIDWRHRKCQAGSCFTSPLCP